MRSVAQQYPLEQLVEEGANAHVKDTGRFKNGVFLTAARLAGKDESYPVEKPRPMLFNALTKGMVHRAGPSIADTVIQTAYNRIGLH